MLDVLSDVPEASLLRNLLGLEKARAEVVDCTHENLLRREPPRDRIAVTIEGDAKHLGHTHAVDVVGIERGVGDGLEQALLLVLEDELGDFAGDLVHAPVGEVVAPPGGLGVEVEQIAEATPWPESSANEADRSLDAPLLVSFSHIARANRKAACACVVEKPRIEDRGGRGVRRHDRLHVVEDVGDGRSLIETRAPIHAAKERAHRLADRELDVEAARVAENGDERADATWDAGQREAEVGPVHLDCLTRREVEREKRLALSAGTQTPEAVAQDRDAARVAEGALTLELCGGEHLGRAVDDRAVL